MTYLISITFVFLLTVENLIFTLCQGQSGEALEGHLSGGRGHQPPVHKHPWRPEVACSPMSRGLEMKPSNYHMSRSAVAWTRD